MKNRIRTLIATLAIIAATGSVGIIAPASAALLEDLADEACIFHLDVNRDEYFQCYYDLMNRLSAAEPAPGAAEQRIEDACRYYDIEFPGSFDRCKAQYTREFLSGGN